MVAVVPPCVFRVFDSRVGRFAGLTVLLSLALSLFATVSAAPVPAAPQLSADSFMLYDHSSGKVIASKDPDKRIAPASLTKMMTAYIAASELKRGTITLDEPVIISEVAQAQPGSRMFIEANSVVPVSDLLRGLIIQSGNDASVALAEHIAATEPVFVDMMNRMARSLGMTSTNFANASGLPADNHYTTARDLSIIASAIISEHPDVYKIYSEREFTFNDIKQKNRNTLLWRDPTVDGMKTGHTQEAGYCLVASANRDGMRLISIVLGTASEKTRIAESQKLLNYGYRFFRTQKVYSAGTSIGKARLWMGELDTIDVGVAEDVFLTLPRDSFGALEQKVELQEYIRAPLAVGRRLGKSVLIVDNQIIGEVPLLALQTVDEGGMFKRMKHSIQRFFQ